MLDEQLQPRLAVDQPGGDPIHIPPELARELIETDSGVGREWSRWRGIGGGRGLVVLLRPDVLELVRQRLNLSTLEGRLDDSDRPAHENPGLHPPKRQTCELGTSIEDRTAGH
jgi:hypothetical protein